MRVAVERDRRVFVPEDLRERLDVHAALEGARREGVAKRMKALVRNVQPLEQQRKSPLIGPDRDVSAAPRDDELAIAAPLHLFEQGHDLLGQRDDPHRRRAFRRLKHHAALGVVTRLADVQQAALEVDVAPFERDQLADPQTAVQAQKHAGQPVFALCRGFDAPLFGLRKALHAPLFRPRTDDLVADVLVDHSEQVRPLERALHHADDVVDGAGRQRPLSRRQRRDKILQFDRGQLLQLLVAQNARDVRPHRNEISLVRPKFHRRAHEVLEPNIEPLFEFHKIPPMRIYLHHTPRAHNSPQKKKRADRRACGCCFVFWLYAFISLR